jgi:hypothetical protein
MNGILKEKNGECAACLKNLVRIFVKKIYKMGCLEGSAWFLKVKHLNSLYRQREVTKFQFMKFCDSLLLSRLDGLESFIDYLPALL